MITPTFTHHLNFNFSRRLLKNIFRGLLSLLILTSPLKAASPSKKKSIHIAILDTAFCPSLISSPKNITILPVQDFTQSNDYSCSKKDMDKIRFHGHWVLEYLVSNIKPDFNLVIHPYVVFNRNGDQFKKYWELAIKQLKEEQINITLMAVGLPIKKENLDSLAKLFKQTKTYIFMASGQRDARLGDNVALFPQDVKEDLLTFMIGEYFAPLAKSEKGFLPPQQLYPLQTDYFINSSSSNQLKNSSLSVTQALVFAIHHCGQEDLLSYLNMQKCLKNKSSTAAIQYNIKANDQEHIINTLKL